MNKEELEVNDFNQENEEVAVEEKETQEVVGDKKKKVDVMSLILVLIGVICIGVAAFGLYDIYMEYKTANDIYDKAANEFVQIKSLGDASEGTEGLMGPWYELASVDIQGLQNKYPDVVGWLFFEDGLISYPILQGDDNDQYLYTTYDGKEAKAGSIFVESTHSGDLSDTHTIIYGHNMKNLSMFGRLKHYKTKEGYYDNHKYFQIFRGDEILRYQIFAYQEVGIDSFVYQEYFTSAKELSNRLLKKSMINPGLTIEDDDKIITFSTCTADDEHRFVVSAVLIETYNITDGILVEEE